MAENDSEALRAAVQKRIELKEAVSRVETAGASASLGPDWRARLVDRLEELGDALRYHASEVEGRDGLLEELACVAPRLVRQIDEIKAEHPVLIGKTKETIDSVASGASVEASRASVLELLLAVSKHRQRGADLVYEGYEVDLGGG